MEENDNKKSGQSKKEKTAKTKVTTKKLQQSKEMPKKASEKKKDTKTAKKQVVSELEEVKVENKKVEKEIENKDTFKSTEIMFLIILTCIVSVIMGWTVCYKLNLKNKKLVGDKNLEQFIQTYNTVVNDYYSDVDKDKLIKGAINGMLGELDDNYSTIIDDTSKSSFDARLEGRYTGIGIEVTNTLDNKIVVLNVFENTPAYEQDIKAGDVITAIDEIDLTGKTTVDMIEYINSNNKEYNLKIIRDGKELEKKLVKKVVTISAVSSKTFDKNDKKIGYIKIDIFSKLATKQFKNALANLENDKIDSLVIDVRNNNGGYLTTASSILSTLLDSKHVIYQTDKKGEVTKFYSDGKKTKTYPIVVLQNEESASAAELLSIALKEEYKATIVGTRSYGKGTIQELITLPNGTEYKYTSKKWLSPSGKWINKKGITPDYEVALDENYMSNPSDDNDNQLQKALSILAE